MCARVCVCVCVCMCVCVYVHAGACVCVCVYVYVCVRVQCIQTEVVTYIYIPALASIDGIVMCCLLSLFLYSVYCWLLRKHCAYNSWCVY